MFCFAPTILAQPSTRISKINIRHVGPPAVSDDLIRANIRAHSSPELSMPQFRALAFLGRNEGAMLGDVATFLTLSLSAASPRQGGRWDGGEAWPEYATGLHPTLALPRRGGGKT